jgi:uncharacterized protein with PIN domain
MAVKDLHLPAMPSLPSATAPSVGILSHRTPEPQALVAGGPRQRYALDIAPEIGRGVVEIASSTRTGRFLEEAEIEVVEFTAEHWTVAAGAFITYGKGRHRAGLNFGDCMTYAVARLAGEPLLCHGDDFPATDLQLADPAP